MQAWLAEAPNVLACLGIIASIYAGIRWVVRPIAKAAKTLDKLTSDMAEVKQELHPNGGSSMKDQITRIETKSDTTMERQKDAALRMDTHLASSTSESEQMWAAVEDLRQRAKEKEQ